MFRAAAFFFAAAALAAGDPAPTPKPVAPDPVGAVKQDLADIHASALSSDGSSALPALSLSDVAAMPSVPDTETALPPESELGPDGLKKRKVGTGNWLVDAMEKAEKDAKAGKSSGRAQDREEQLKADMELLRGDDRDPAHPEQASALDLTAKSKTEADDLKAPAYNPLDAFMAGWISAQDHELLVPAKSDPADPAHGRGDGLDLAPSDGLLAGPEPASLNELRAAPNPYLADLELAPPPGAGLPAAILAPLAPADLLEPAVAPLLGGGDVPGSEGSRSVVPDFAQPSGDDKYFPQLKKF